MEPKEYHNTGAKSGKDSRRLLSSKRAFSLFTILKWIQSGILISYQISVGQLKHKLDQLLRIPW
jgi:hypothetical protein